MNKLIGTTLLVGITGGLFVLAWAILPWLMAGVGMIFVSLLMAGSVMDFKTFTLPEPLLIIGAILGLSCSYYVPELHAASTSWGGLWAAFSALCLSTGGLLWFSSGLESLLRKPAMGLGDAYWLGVIATFTGPWGALFSLLVGSMFGCLFIGIAVISEKVWGIQLGPRLPAAAFLEEGSLAYRAEAPCPLAGGVAVPFGPWLSLAAAVYFVFFQQDYMHFLQQLFKGVSPFL
jgi:leader peptidase (prepilin peptidase)/N-methyltransferase